MPKRGTQKPEISDTVVLEPRTSVSSFDGLQWALQKAVGGAIAAFLYGDNKEQVKQFYKTPTSRKNKEKLAQLASQVYGYLNSAITEHSNIEDFFFRVWPRIEIDRKSGEIRGEPRFEVDMFRYMGRVSAKAVESETNLDVAFVQAQGDQIVSPSFARMLRKAVSQLMGVDLKVYAEPRSAPKPLKSKMADARPHLFIGEGGVFSLGSEIGKAGSRLFLESDGKTSEIRKEGDLTRFIVEHSGVRPEIFGSDTAFRPMDDEVAKIGMKLAEGASTELFDVIGSLKIEQELDRMSKEIGKLSDGVDETRTSAVSIFKTRLAEQRDKWIALKSGYEAAVEEMEHLTRDYDRKRMTYEAYDVRRFQAVREKKAIERDLVELQSYVKGELGRELAKLVEESKVARGEES
jgi:hypothetical protein